MNQHAILQNVRRIAQPGVIWQALPNAIDVISDMDC